MRAALTVPDGRGGGARQAAAYPSKPATHSRSQLAQDNNSTEHGSWGPSRSMQGRESRGRPGHRGGTERSCPTLAERPQPHASCSSCSAAASKQRSSSSRLLSTSARRGSVCGEGGQKCGNRRQPVGRLAQGSGSPLGYTCRACCAHFGLARPPTTQPGRSSTHPNSSLRSSPAPQTVTARLEQQPPWQPPAGGPPAGPPPHRRRAAAAPPPAALPPHAGSASAPGCVYRRICVSSPLLGVQAKEEAGGREGSRPPAAATRIQGLSPPGRFFASCSSL